MENLKTKGIILIIIGMFFAFSNPVDARRVQDATESLIATVESYIEEGDYETAKNLITEYFPKELESFYGSIRKQPMSGSEQNELHQTLSSSKETALEIMTAQVYKTAARLIERGRTFPMETKIEAARFGYLTVLLFICELNMGNLEKHKVMMSTMPDVYFDMLLISFAPFMRGFNSEKSEEIRSYKIKSQTLITEHLQEWLSKYVDKEVFDTAELEDTMTEDGLREYAYYQTLATVILSLKGFQVPHFSEITEVTENIDGVNIVSCSNLSAEGLAVFREGSRYPEANFIIIPFFEWLGTTKDERVGVTKGYIYTDRGLFFMEFGQTLEVDYFINNLTPTDSYLYNILDQIIEKYRIPNTDFEQLGELTVNKALSMTMLYMAGINVPRGNMNLKSTRSVRSVAERLRIFMENQEIEEVVIKPYNTNCGTGIEYFSRDQIAEAAAYIEKLTQKYGGVRYEERIYPPKIEVDGSLYDWNLRLFLSRDIEDNWVVSDIAVRYGEGVVNISRGAKTMTWDDLIFYLGLSDSEASDLRERVEDISIRSAKVIENAALNMDKETASAHQDFMSSDVICSHDLTPYIIELNNHYSGAMWNLDDAGGEMGRSSRDWVLTMIRRAAEYRESLNEDEE
jgi:hypothetical protein